MPDEPKLPKDFGARVRAARAYKDNLSQEDFGAALNRPGMTSSTVRRWEKGAVPPTMARTAIIARLAEVTGLPESFFWANSTTDASDARLAKIERQQIELRDHLSQLVGLLTGDANKTALLSDALVRALERAMSQRAREAGRTRRPQPKRPPSARQPPAA